MAIVAFVIRSNHGARPYEAFVKVPGSINFVPVRAPVPGYVTTFVSAGEAQQAVQQTRGGNIMRWDLVEVDGDGVEKWTSSG